MSLGQCRGITKAGTPCRNRSNCRWHSAEGDGLADLIEKPLEAVAAPIKRGLAGMRNFVRGVRTGPTRRLEDFLRSGKDDPVVALFIGRTPVSAGAQTLMNALSLGRFSQTAKDLSYDDVFHSAAFAELASGRIIRLERNHVVEAKDAQPSDAKFTFYPVPLPTNRNVTLKELVDNAALKEAEKGKNIYLYNPASNNCQAFVQSLIEDNGLKDNITDLETLEALEPQNAQALVESLGAASGIPLQVTNLAARGDRLIHGDGLLDQISNHHLSVSELFAHINAGSR